MSSRKDRRSAYIKTAPDQFAASLAGGSRFDSLEKGPQRDDGGNDAASAEKEGSTKGKQTRRVESRPRSAKEAARAAREAIVRGTGSSDRLSTSRRSSDPSAPSKDSSSTQDSAGRGAEMGRLSVVGAIVLAALVVISPWFYGSVTPLYVFVLLIGFASLVALWWTTVATQGGRAIQLPWNLVPLLLALLFAGFQLVPLPEAWLKTLAPDQYALREDLGLVPSAQVTAEPATQSPVGEGDSANESTDDNEASGDSVSEPADALGPIYPSRDGLPLSLNPKGTRDYLVLLLIATTSFACSVVFLRRRRWFLAFATVVGVNGFLLSVFGIVQYFTGDGKLFWTYAVERSSPFASFVNGNNAGGYLNLCLACLLGVALNAFRSSVHNRRLTLAAESSDWPDTGKDDDASRTFGAAFLSWFADLTVWKLFLLLMISAVMTGVFLTLSRGAIIANLVALGLTSLVMMFSKRHRAAGTGLIIVVILGGILTFGLNEVQTVKRELVTLQEMEFENDARLLLLKDLAPHWKSYVWTGAGLGSFRDIYRIHRAGTNDLWFYHADNTFLEAYFETGLIGTSLLLICIGWTLWQAIYLVRFGETTADNAIGVIAVFAVFSQFVQAFSDFGLYVPSNMILMAAICGGTAIHAQRVAEARKASRTGSRNVRLAMPTLVAWMIPLALFGAMIWLVRPMQREVELSFAMDRARALLNVQDKSELDPVELDQAIEQLSALAELTEDGDAYRRLGDLNVVRFRIDFARRILRNSERFNLGLNWGTAYPLTSMPSVHFMIIAGESIWGVDSQRLTPQDPLVAGYLAPAFDAYTLSRHYAPFQALTYMRLAELSVLRKDPNLEDLAIKRAVMLSPGRAEIQVRAGVLKANRGDEEEARKYWERSLALSEQFREQILNDAALLFSHEDIVPDLLPNNPTEMTYLMERLELVNKKRSRHFPDDPQLVELERLIREEAVAVYERASQEDPERLSVEDYIAWHNVHRELGEEEAAKSVLRKAIEIYPKQTEHRYELARMLRAEARYAEALELINECVFYSNDAKFGKEQNELKDALKKEQGQK